jgi:hypothetical protein
MIVCVGNGDGVIVMGINVDVETGVGERAVGIGVSTDKAIVCFPQADRKARETIQIIFSIC